MKLTRRQRDALDFIWGLVLLSITVGLSGAIVLSIPALIVAWILS